MLNIAEGIELANLNLNQLLIHENLFNKAEEVEFLLEAKICKNIEILKNKFIDISTSAMKIQACSGLLADNEIRGAYGGIWVHN